MTARPPGGRPHPAPIVGHTETPAARDRVLSISPSDTEVGATPAGRTAPGEPMTPTTDGPYFLTPRVLDQQAFDELGGTLRTLIDDAGRAGLDLREIVRQAGVTDAAAAKASARLQERLNLAAGMLKAFQTQIDQAARIGETFTEQASRVESAGRTAVAAADAAAQRVTERAAALDAEVDALTDAVLRRVESRLESELDAAVDAAATRLTARLEPILAVVARLPDEVERTLEVVRNASEQAEHAERTVCVVAARNGRLLQRADEVVATLRDGVREAQRLRGELAADAEQTTQSLDHLLAQATETMEVIREDYALCDAAAREIDARLVAFGPPINRLEQLEAEHRRLEDLLARLEPWRALLGRDATRDGEDVIEHLVDELGRRVAMHLAEPKRDRRADPHRAAVTQITTDGLPVAFPFPESRERA